jgi:large subunit ribosomal protein L18
VSEGPRYRVAFRRRRDGLTDYRQRLRLLKSGEPRAIVRFSLRRVRVSVTRYDATGDRVLASADSAELEALGFPAKSLASTPASYLTGYLAGLRAKSAGAGSAVLDAGLRAPSGGGRLLGALKGLLDAGIEIPHGEAKFPTADRMNGKHLPTPLPKPLESYKADLPGRVERPKETPK